MSRLLTRVHLFMNVAIPIRHSINKYIIISRANRHVCLFITRLYITSHVYSRQIYHDVHNCTHECTLRFKMHAHSHTIRLAHEAYANCSDVFSNFYYSLYEYSRITSTKVPIILHDNLRRESHGNLKTIITIKDYNGLKVGNVEYFN